MIATALLTTALESASATCGSGVEARTALEKKLALATPATTFAELIERLGPPMIREEYWEPGPPRQLEWLLSGESGNRTASRVYVCDFDKEDRLVGCAPARWGDTGELTEFQTVPETAWKKIEEGWRISTVYRLLCPPPVEDVAVLGPQEIEARYAVRVPGWKHDICHGTLSFEKGRVSRKEMYCR